MNNVPIIRLFKTQESFKYLWLRYIENFDLSQHCAKCFIGKYSSRFRFGANVTNIINAPLDEHSAKYYYLCGVTTPYRYANNLHIAFRYKKDSTIIYNDGKTIVEIVNAEKIEIKITNYDKESVGKLPEYNTCRNWQFAYLMTYGE